MLLATTQVEDFDQFMAVFSNAGADKRKQHGSKGALVFRDPAEDDRVWVIFDWDAQGWQSFVSDPEVPPIMKEAGHKAKAAGRGVRRPVRRLSATAPGWTERPASAGLSCFLAGRRLISAAWGRGRTRRRTHRPETWRKQCARPGRE